MERFKVLAICWANSCRSPMIEMVFRDRVAAMWPDDPLAWSISSAGISVGRPGADMDPKSRKALQRLAVPAGSFASRQLTVEHLQDADLVLTAERDHRALIVSAMPERAASTFTLRQFAHLCALTTDVSADDPRTQGAMLREGVLAQRGRRFAAPDKDDLVDPVGRSIRQFVKTGRAVVAAVDQIAARLRR